MMKAIRKTKHNAGESLIETLVSLLIITLSIALLVTTIGFTVNKIKNSEKQFDGYYDGNDILTGVDYTIPKNTDGSDDTGAASLETYGPIDITLASSVASGGVLARTSIETHHDIITGNQAANNG